MLSIEKIFFYSIIGAIEALHVYPLYIYKHKGEDCFEH